MVREQGTGNREQGIGNRFWAILLFVTYSKFSLSEVHLMRARCPHHKSFIINICTS
ncbi:hypothetical protein [Dolichospermum circinale]|uniref:hypothetical protein n=1 Tax=Dolichospermum circinale TaxID=109265 RepID=UPI0018C9BA2B|nr:hypothetical protein [Dolichospermum circinale]